MIGWAEIACGIAIVTILLYYYLTSTYHVWKKLGVVGPKPIPVFGTVKAVVLGKSAMGTYLKEVYDEYKKHRMFGIFIVKEPYLVVTDPELIRDVLVKHFSNFADRGITFCEKSDVMSPHLFNLEPKRWRPLRVRLSPIFTSGKLKDMFTTISECSEYLEKLVAKAAEKAEPVEISEITSRFTIDVISTCAFGIDAKTLTDEEKEFRRMSKLLFSASGTGTTKTRLEQFLPSMCKLLLFFMKEDDKNSFFSIITLETMKYRREKKIYRNDFINTLLELQDHPEKLDDVELTDKLAVAQAFIFFAAGFETSSSTITHALYELAMNPDVQSKLRKEIREAITEDNQLNYETVKNMEYLNAVVKETLRKYPPATFLRRRAENSHSFQGTKVTIPSGQRIMIPVYAIHHDPSIYPNPDVFDPDRFRHGNEATRHPMNYLPFGSGPRNCIAGRFAPHQMKVGLIKILRDYKVDVCDKTPIPYIIHPKTFLLSSLESIFLKVSKCEET